MSHFDTIHHPRTDSHVFSHVCGCFAETGTVEEWSADIETVVTAVVVHTDNGESYDGSVGFVDAGNDDRADVLAYWADRWAPYFTVLHYVIGSRCLSCGESVGHFNH